MPIDPASLEPGERVVWSGEPVPLRYAQARSGLRVMAGLAVLVLSEFLTAAARDGRLPPWIGALFLVIAVLLLLSPLLLIWRARLTSYALTDRRALMAIERPFGRRIVMPLSHIQSVELRPRSGGVGDVLIHEAVLGKALPSRGGFLAIRDAAKVERLLTSMLPPAPDR
jgi:hypothetical protein